MKKYFSKAIFYKDYKSALVFTLLMTYSLIQNTLSHTKLDLREAQSFLDGTLKHSATSYTLDMGNSIAFIFICVIFICIMIPVIFGFDRFKEMYSLGAMPFTKKQIIITKLSIIYSSIIITVFVNYLTLAGIYFKNKAVFDKVPLGRRFSNIAVDGITFLLILLCIASFFALVHCLTGKSVFGVVVGYFSMSYPGILAALLGILINYNFKDTPQVIIRLFNSLNNFISIVFNRDVNLGLINISMFIIIFLISILIVYFYNKIPTKKSGELFTFKFSEVLFKIGISTLAALLVIMALVSIAYPSKAIPSSVHIVPVNLIVIVVIPLSYCIQTKIFKRLTSCQ